MKNVLIVVIVLAVIVVGWKLLSGKMGPADNNVSETSLTPISPEEQEEQMGGPEKPTGFVPKESLQN